MYIGCGRIQVLYEMPCLFGLAREIDRSSYQHNFTFQGSESPSIRQLWLAQLQVCMEVPGDQNTQHPQAIQTPTKKRLNLRPCIGLRNPEPSFVGRFLKDCILGFEGLEPEPMKQDGIGLFMEIHP